MKLISLLLYSHVAQTRVKTRQQSLAVGPWGLELEDSLELGGWNLELAHIHAPPPRNDENLSDAASLQTINDARLVEVVGRHFHFDAVANRQTDEPFAHFS